MTIPIIDGHHHIWRQTDLPWLMGPMQPRIFGAYEAIRRDYPIEEYRADAEREGVVRSVYVQANWPIERFADEVEWVQTTADRVGWPHAIVGYADFLVHDVRPALDRLKKYPLMRGVRQQLHWHENPQYRFAAHPDLADDPVLQRNVARLADYGYSFELQVFPGQMAGAARLAESCPAVTFVLQHAGMLECLSADGVAAWRRGMTELARSKNVVAKLSGLGTFLHRNDARHIAFMARETLALFGPVRCLFGSNFPIEKLWTQFQPLVAAYREAIAHLDVEDQRAVLHDTAARIYRIDSG